MITTVWVNCSLKSLSIPATSKQFILYTLKQDDPVFRELKNATMLLWESGEENIGWILKSHHLFTCVLTERNVTQMTWGTGCSVSVHWEAVQINHCVCAWRRCCKAAHLHLNAARELCAWKIIFQCDYLKPVEAMPLCAEIASYTICIIYGRHLHYSSSLQEENAT